MGEWEEHCWYELLRKYPQSHHDFNHRLDRWQVPGSETARQVLDRYLPALRRVARQHDGQTVAIFSHGAAMRIVLGTLQGLSLLEIGEEGVGEIGWYGLLPQWQGRDQGIQPLGQIIQRCRHMGLLRLRLRCGDDRQRSFWEKLGFSQVGGDVMEKNITPRVLDAHIPL